MNNLYKYTYSIHFLLADFSISSSIILLLELFFLLNEPDKITTRGNLLHSPDRVILEEKKEKKKRLLFFVLPDLDDGSIRGITRTGTKQVSQLCFVRKVKYDIHRIFQL